MVPWEQPATGGGPPRVLVVGAGGLGSPVALALAGAGVALRLVDDDRVSLDNLARQLLYSGDQVGELKVEAARRRLGGGGGLEVRAARLEAGSFRELAQGCSLVVDGSDNFPTRFLLNDACVLFGLPLVHAGILRFSGQLMTILPGSGPCLRCLFPQPPPAGSVPGCAEAGVLGAVAGVVGALQAQEALRLIRGQEPRFAGRLWAYDALAGRCRILRVKRDRACPACGEHPAITALEEEHYHFPSREPRAAP